MSKPTVSIIIPTFQHATTIKVCLESILNQTHPPYEIIVVNDGSTDWTLTILDEYRDRIRLINQPNLGGNIARNNGFKVATGKYVIFCDADVRMRPYMLERMVRTLEEHPEVSYAYCQFRLGWKKFHSYKFSARRLRRINYIHTTSMIRREHFPGFDERINRFQDWDLWLTMLKNGHRGIFISKTMFKIQTTNARVGISKWRPSALHMIPWRLIRWMPPAIKYYEEARKIIAKKHGL
ncbi:glycosyltransferase family 2 protein [Patescibacteria group bacterium]